MDGDTTERLSQEGQCPEDGFNGLLARASAFAGGVLSSIQTLAGTTACKGVQIARLKDWAKENDCWIENPESLGVFSDYDFIGFSHNRDGKVCAVLRQQFVVNAHEATPEDIKAEFERIGFHAKDNGEYYTNGIHDIFDAVPNNVLVGDDGNYYFIDTIIFLSDNNHLGWCATVVSKTFLCLLRSYINYL